MRGRRGVAMLAALWLVVAIAVVALQFSLDARERRILGINASERGWGRGAAVGALANMQARLEVVLRAPAAGTQALQGTRAGDPWMDVDSLFSGTIVIDSVPVEVTAMDLGTRLNINTVSETGLKAFLAYVLGDFGLADHLTQAILDWRDADDLARPNGIERDGYIKKGLLALPTNVTFQDVKDLLQVDGITPEIFARIEPFFTPYGTGAINLNSAPQEVLRSLPGMTDQILANILAQRSRGLRITSVASVVPGAAEAAGGGRGGGPVAIVNQQVQQLNQAATVLTSQLMLTITAKVAPQAQTVKLRAFVQRNGTTAPIWWQQWQ